MIPTVVLAVMAIKINMMMDMFTNTTYNSLRDAGIQE